MAEIPFDTWFAIWQIQQEAELGKDNDSTLDHIYELASGVLRDFNSPTYSDSPLVRNGVLGSDETPPPS